MDLHMHMRHAQARHYSSNNVTTLAAESQEDSEEKALWRAFGPQSKEQWTRKRRSGEAVGGVRLCGWRLSESPNLLLVTAGSTVVSNHRCFNCYQLSDVGLRSCFKNCWLLTWLEDGLHFCVIE